VAAYAAQNQRRRKMSEKITSLFDGLNRRQVLKTGMVAGATALMPGFIGRAKAKTPGLVVFGLSSYPPGFKPGKTRVPQARL
jgi:hypothetical protein